LDFLQCREEAFDGRHHRSGHAQFPDVAFHFGLERGDVDAIDLGCGDQPSRRAIWLLVFRQGAGASASEYRFDCTATVWTAAGGSISAIKYAVIVDTNTGLLLCHSQLSASQFSVTSGNTLTVTPSANGIFELN
jgi:hypothetical protein